ncbi:MAG: hypothetical protein PHC56_02665 [Herbinix sp.]|nr:hypothetical protein [Herbinix sp.]
MIKYVENIVKKVDKCWIKEYIYNSQKSEEGRLIKMNKVESIINNNTLEDSIECGYYYLPSEVCKNIIITAGLSGAHYSQAVKRIRSRIRHRKETVGDILPALQSVNQDIISYYAGELAEGLVKAAGNGKCVDIAIGYPKILVISVN